LKSDATNHRYYFITLLIHDNPTYVVPDGGRDRGRHSTGSLSNNDRMLSISTFDDAVTEYADSAAALYTVFTGPNARCRQSQSHRCDETHYWHSAGRVETSSKTITTPRTTFISRTGLQSDQLLRPATGVVSGVISYCSATPTKAMPTN